MEIRRRLTFQFIGIVALILFMSLFLIYVSFSKFRRNEFYDRLSSKAQLVAQMLIDIDEIDAITLTKIERKNPLSLPNEIILIYNHENELIYSNGNTDNIKVDTTIINRTKIDKEINLQQGPYEIYGQFYTGQNDRIVVFCAATDIFGLKKLNRLKLILVLVYFISLIIIYFFGKQYSARALKPISRIIRQVDQIEINNLKVRLDEGNGTDELARLSRTFNNMLSRVDSAFEMQKSFISNASHELRTPLTSLTGQLEVILLNERTSSEYIETISSALEDIKGMNQVVNKLLVLAQASSEYTSEGFVSFRIDDLLWQTRNELLKVNPEYSIIITFDESIDDEKRLTIYGNTSLMKSALNNLMENGCKYSQNQEVKINFESEKNWLKIHFSDEGIGIYPDEIQNIIQPFYRGKNTMGKKGIGIGLSLVFKIVQLHKGFLDIESQVNKGSTFTIKLPNIENANGLK